MNTMPDSPQDRVDALNSNFWNELCGTVLATELGIKDYSLESLARYDQAYFDFYPYLKSYFPIEDMKGKEILEVGLGYGTLSEWLAKSGVRYNGLDIARGPVDMVNHRLSQNNLPGQARQGSVLKCPFPDESLDYFVSIGCLHVTGSTEKAIGEAWRVLKPGGKAIIMVYYAYSYRRIFHYPYEALRYFLMERFGIPMPLKMRHLKSDRDFHLDGEAAPATEYLSARDLRRMAKDFSGFSYKLENFWPEGLLKRCKRDDMLDSWVSRNMGMDIYVTLTK